MYRWRNELRCLNVPLRVQNLHSNTVIVKYLITGLGNIGYEYEGTRHNIGFEAVDFICKKLDGSWRADHHGDLAEVKFKGRTLILLKPSTYMNLSGKAIRYWEGLRAFEMAQVVHDATVVFCRLYVDHKSRTRDQMVQAARSGKQNIVEGSQASGTSKKTELKLVGIARASLEELLTDYTDFLRQHGHELWPKDHPKAVFIRKLCYKENLSYTTYRTYVESKGPENAANTMVCVVHQTNYLLDQLLRQLDKAFLEEGGFTERMHRLRSKRRSEEQ